MTDKLTEARRRGGLSTSAKKAAQVRLNGCAPCRPGKRRGRPPKSNPHDP